MIYGRRIIDFKSSGLSFRKILKKINNEGLTMFQLIKNTRNMINRKFSRTFLEIYPGNVKKDSYRVDFELGKTFNSFGDGFYY